MSCTPAISTDADADACPISISCRSLNRLGFEVDSARLRSLAVDPETKIPRRSAILTGKLRDTGAFAAGGANGYVVLLKAADMEKALEANMTEVSIAQGCAAWWDAPSWGIMQMLRSCLHACEPTQTSAHMSQCIRLDGAPADGLSCEPQGQHARLTVPSRLAAVSLRQDCRLFMLPWPGLATLACCPALA